MLRADANYGYTPKEAIRVCRMCERRGVGLELLDRPVPKWDLAGMAQVRAAVDVPIEADEAAYTPHDVVQIIRHQAADVINIKIGKAGGLYRGGCRGRRPRMRHRHREGPGRQGRRQAAPGRRHPLAAPRRRVHGADAARPAAYRPAGRRPGTAPERRLPQRPARPGLNVTLDEAKIHNDEIPKHH